jgi:hypothetical protein
MLDFGEKKAYEGCVHRHRFRNMAVRTKWRRTFPAIFAGVALLTGSAQSQVSLTNQFKGPGTGLWDLRWVTSTSTLEIVVPKGFQSSISNTVLACEAQFAIDGRGGVTGEAETPLQLVENGTETNVFAGSWKSRGLVSSGNGILRITVSAQAKGEAVLDNVTRLVSGWDTYSLIFNSKTTTLLGRVSERISASGLGSIWNTNRVGAFTNFSGWGDGSWTLVLNLNSPAGNAVSGTATVTLNTGWVIPFSVVGSASKLRLKGNDEATGAFVNITFRGTQISRMNGRIFGQSVHYSVPPPPPFSPTGGVTGVFFLGAGAGASGP